MTKIALQAFIPDTEKASPIWLDISEAYDELRSDLSQLLQQTLQWFMARYGTLLIQILNNNLDEFFGSSKRTSKFSDAVSVLELYEETIKDIQKVNEHSTVCNDTCREYHSIVWTC